MSGSLTDRGNSQHFRVLVELFSTLFDTQVTERPRKYRGSFSAFFCEFNFSGREADTL